ncbi:DUF1080 domain-containing protein [Sphingobacterium alkalisoli]|uniref:DUF1080 domain-containing protein n=1 Tax=Sphingobacterium alkalisoli TaxID=1874115 RepID=A0A4U0GWI2_9SPHI|nr:DUF1080 domain-containing protein [Sphingobacterium alkalisoli]TJY63490.1 DUF1080 domain-containing protein [Sphingobacterium alkalisoli]GGH26414.1 hypothetical protein GCM10011418_35640 [Sphingobacterium alkalisoli]
MKIKTKILYILGLGVLTSSSTLFNQKHDEEWKSLFNGKDLEGWTAKIYPYKVGENYAGTFRVKNDVIQVNYDGYEKSFDDRFGHLYYNTPYSHYHLKLEYRFIGDLYPGAPSYTLRNSGIMFHAQDPKTMPANQDWPISVEMQFLGGLSDGKTRTTGNMCSPGTHIYYKGELLETHCINSTSKTYDGDQWVKAELIVLGDSIIHHIIEGDTVLSYSKPHIGGSVVNNFDSQVKIDGKALKRGFIALQSEGQPIEFRKILLKDLSKSTKN